MAATSGVVRRGKGCAWAGDVPKSRDAEMRFGIWAGAASCDKEARLWNTGRWANGACG